MLAATGPPAFANAATLSMTGEKRASAPARRSAAADRIESKEVRSRAWTVTS